MADISAQISLYPLLHERRSPVIDAAMNEFRRLGLEVRPGAMSTLVIGSEAAIFAALRKAFRAASGRGRAVMVVTVSNACPLPAVKHRPAPTRRRGKSSRAGRTDRR